MIDKGIKNKQPLEIVLQWLFVSFEIVTSFTYTKHELLKRGK